MAQTVWGSAAFVAGGVGYVETYGEASYSQTQGWEQEIRYRGWAADLLALGDAFIAAGWEARTETTNSQWPTLIVKVPNDGEEEHTDRWEFNIGFKQQDLFSNAGIIQYLLTGGFTAPEIVDLAVQLRKYLDADTSNGVVDNAQGDAAAAVYQMMQQGQEFVEVAQPVISRKRTYDISYSGTLMSTQVTQKVYSTAGLISTFGVPTIVQAQITADPATAMTNFAWGWKMRKNNLVIIPSKNKIEEQVDFEYDLWSTVAYTYVS